MKAAINSPKSVKAIPTPHIITNKNCLEKYPCNLLAPTLNSAGITPATLAIATNTTIQANLCISIFKVEPNKVNSGITTTLDKIFPAT